MPSQHSQHGARSGRGSQVPHAFTLVELLIVVSIIALLISTLMPALTKAKSAARMTQCQSNLRRLTIGWLLYANDHRGVAAGASWYATYYHDGVQYHYPGRQIPYYINPKWTGMSPWLMTCPDLDAAPERLAGDPYWAGTYVYNGYWYAKGNYFNPANLRSVKIGSVRGLSMKVTFFDGVGFVSNPHYGKDQFGDYYLNGRHGGKADKVMSSILERHVNTAFGDGHVELVYWTPQEAAQRFDQYMKIP